MVSGNGDKTLKVWEAGSVAIGWMYESESVPLAHVQRRISRHAVKALPHIKQFVEVRHLQDAAHITGRMINVDLDPMQVHRCQNSENPTGEDANINQVYDQHLAIIRTDQCKQLVSALIHGARFQQVLAVKAHNRQRAGLVNVKDLRMHHNATFAEDCRMS
jgi:hypothetical protein